jgi:CRP/FNR family cyclic AMP-dependent transcriptional regulator
MLIEGTKMDWETLCSVALSYATAYYGLESDCFTGKNPSRKMRDNTKIENYNKNNQQWHNSPLHNSVARGYFMTTLLINNYYNNNPIRQTALNHFIRLCDIKTYPPKTTLIHLGQVNQTLFYIMEGSVVVEADVDDKELVLAYLSRGDFIGEIGVFNGKDARMVNVITRCECKIAEMSHEYIKTALKKDLPDYAADILFMLGEQMAQRLLKTTRNFRDLAFMDTKGRIARTLLDLCKEPDAMTHPDGMQLHISRQEIGRIAGCSREIVGRVLKELEEKGLISAHGKTIVVFGTR